jgi:hypothetical protein
MDAVDGRVYLSTTFLGKAVRTADDVYEYFDESMSPVPPEYTRKTYDECSRVENQLEEAFQTAGVDIEFRHQGSVTNNTHIRIYSDIDLLVIERAFHFVKPPLPVVQPYVGNPYEELLHNRRLCSESLAQRFPKTTLEIAGARSLRISGGSLARSIDVVPCAWLRTHEAVNLGLRSHWGIKLLDISRQEYIENYPFLHNERIQVRDQALGGALRPLIRLVKAIRADSDQKIDIASYDIAGLCYNAPDETFAAGPGNGARLLLGFLKYVVGLLNWENLRTPLLVPNGTRHLFGGEGINVAELGKLCQESLDLLELGRAAA